MATPNPNDGVMKIEAMLEKGQARFTKECCIYRVPHNIRKLKEDAYTPEIVSIGPFHHGNEKLLKMEDHKRLYCKQFIERSETNKLESFVNCVQELEPKIRGCYSDDIKLSKEELVMVILVDCCFILEFLLRYHFMLTHGDDTILLPQRLRLYIQYDLLLLENQVPFFVLDKLYNLVFPSTFIGGSQSQSHDRHPSLLSLAIYHIVPGRIIFPGDYNGELSVSNIGGIAHFTDLSRKLLLLSCNLSISSCSREAQVAQIYSATELKEAGVKFEVKKDSQCLLDLQLSGHTLRIPFFRVEDTTEVVWRNLLAFEQCHCINESYLADYIIVLDFLINTDKDVDLLIKKGIIENWLGDSNAVAKMFNGLAVNIFTPDFNEKYSHIFQRLNAFCARPWNKKVATLRRDYCNTPWKTVASIAGIFLLVLTVVQTVFSILQGVH
ncbi:UPF0481 protein At3g47200-like [Arachis stenosperma]|uniref:UPF0481 protein At3g47200-like n=1 Tax=Arachis stenosperma TaxID=217475 RepID=UPI0025AD2B63|nr:UPF0481 protein At3g47200-like [Arachis stenosperma]XP_057726835.1 UPF0481 protein At3g47200-like [Arachis stenosperma]